MAGKITVNEKRRVELSDFLGLDVATSPVSVSPRRASAAVNWEPVNGVNRKRRGIEQIYDALPARINGIFPFVRHDGTEELIVYAGTAFYSIRRADGALTEIPVKNTVGMLPSGGLEDRRCQGFYSDGCLYFVGCGIYLRYGYFDGAYEVRTVEPYVPVTTVGIGSIDSSDSARALLDYVNLLTPKRKNTLYGHSLATKWRLDGAIVNNSEVVVEADVLKEGSAVHVVYKNDGESKESLYDSTGKIVGTVFFSAGEISLLEKTVPPSSEPNITVSFTAAEGAFGGTGFGGMSRIYGCRFGCLFGVEGAEDRLFLSGNPQYPNTVFFSERRDFTYFPDQFTAVLGTDALAVTGFLPLSDSALAIFKEEDEREASVYYLRGKYRSFYSEDGELRKMLPVFSLSSSGAGESLVSPYATGVLGGDPLILSKNGVFAIELSSVFSTDVRLTRSRSFTITPRLLEEELSEAVATTDGDRFYLSVGGHCYLADKKYTYRNEATGQVEYDWWYWEDFYARVFAHVDGELWFGTETGAIYRIGESFLDRSFMTTKVGEVAIDYTEGGLAVKRGYSILLLEGRHMQILTEGVMARIIRGCLKVENRRIYVDEETLPLLSEGLAVYVGSPSSSALKEGRIYYITDVDRVAGCFSLGETVGGYPVDLSGIDTALRLFTEVSGRDIYTGRTSPLSGVVSVRLSPQGKDLVLENYFRPRAEGAAERVIPTDPICRFFIETSVEASWETPMLDLGAAFYKKDLLSVEVAARRAMGEVLSVGYRTEGGKSGTEVLLPDQISFSRTDFKSFSFSGERPSVVSIPVREKGFERISFVFSSHSDTPTEVYSVGGIYKINHMKKGEF